MPYREACPEPQAAGEEDHELLFRPSNRDARNRLSMGVVQLFTLPTLAASIGGAFAGPWGAVVALLASAILVGWWWRRQQQGEDFVLRVIEGRSA